MSCHTGAQVRRFSRVLTLNGHMPSPPLTHDTSFAVNTYHKNIAGPTEESDDMGYQILT